MKSKILWIDDEDIFLERTIPLIEYEGFDITGYSSPNQGIDDFRKNASDYSLVLLDLFMAEKDGIEVFKELRLLNSGIPIIFVSGYLGEPLYESQFSSLEEKTLGINKPFPITESKDFKSIIDQIRIASNEYETKMQVSDKTSTQSTDNFVIEGSGKENMDREKEQGQVGSLDRPFGISFKSFKNLSTKEIALLNRHAYKKNVEFNRNFFANNPQCDWIVIAEYPGNIIKSGKAEEELAKEEILAIAEKYNGPVFIYDRPRNIVEETVEWSYKVAKDDHYPTVLLEFRTSKDAQQILFDFDTGSNTSFISFEELERFHLIGPSAGETRNSELRGEHYSYVPDEFNCIIIGHSGGRRKIKVKCEVVLEWQNSPFTRHYANRVGLIGRNILLDNKLVLILDGEKMTTNLPKDKTWWPKK